MLSLVTFSRTFPNDPLFLSTRLNLSGLNLIKRSRSNFCAN
ncbi:hypothetical protein GXM_10082 [Nostoc sphaeroides CCNUC1]|uniref:Uncharacterized protein n=1 Tax=Nostoc sphaeroides CCNUC1 TaxID=2653204 RepID=A0A5P8WJ20_9NOSO|nr:hypothetical protein GXM_10082 [Nostoc sphaeroides CCNUC1]